MKHRIVFCLVAFFFAVSTRTVSAQGTAFFYQGRLNDNGSAANGAYDLRFALFDANTNGNAIGLTQTNFATAVSSGTFAVTLDFGPVFTGTNYWLGVGVRTNAGVASTNAYTILWPRQPVLPVPYAVFATRASNLLGVLSATQLVGTLPSAQISGTYLGSVNFTNTTNSFQGTFFGNGAGLDSLNASNITTGTLADARLTTNVALLNGNNQVFTGTNFFNGVNSFTNRNNAFTGSFFGNGLVGWLPVYGVSTQAVANAGYLLLNSNLVTVTLPPTASLLIGDIVRISGPMSGGWRVAQNAGQYVAGIFYSATYASLVAASAGSIGWRALACSSDGVKMVGAAGGGGGISTSTDSGQNWTSQTTTYSPDAVASSADGVRLLGATRGGVVILSTNSGNVWSQFIAATIEWSGACSSADGSKFAVCVSNAAASGTAYVWNNYGATSNFPASPMGAGLSGIACSSDCTKLVTVGFGGIYTSTNTGTSWVSRFSGGNWTCVASSADGNKLAAAITGGSVYTSTNAGASWQAQSNAPVAAWSAISLSADGGRIVAVVNGGSVYFSANFGVSWTKISSGNQNWRAAVCSSEGTRMAAGYATTLTTGALYYWNAVQQDAGSTVGTNGVVTGGPRTSIELQYTGPDAGGNARFMPVGGIGSFWAN